MTKAEYSKKWRKENPEKVKEYSKKYYQENSEKIKQYKKENLEKIKEYKKQWRQENPEYHKKYDKKYRKENPEYHKRWQKENPEKIKEHKRQYKKRRQTDPKYRLDSNMSSSISLSLKGKKAGRHWESLVNYTLQDLAKHLEKQFDEKMNWNNQGSYWHCDHIKPKSLFHYETAEDSEFKQCWALKNLQPLEAIANKRKGNHY